MIDAAQARDGKKLLRDGWSDEDVERFTGLSLPSIVLLRAEAACAVPVYVQRSVRPGAQGRLRI